MPKDAISVLETAVFPGRKFSGASFVTGSADDRISGGLLCTRTRVFGGAGGVEAQVDDCAGWNVVRSRAERARKR